MSKLIWGGIALTGCVAVGLYVAARHATSYPESLFSRCVSVASVMARGCNPVAAVHGIAQGDAETSETGGVAGGGLVEPIVIEKPGANAQPEVINQFRPGAFVDSPEGNFTPDLEIPLQDLEPVIHPDLPVALDKNPHYMPYADEEPTTSEPPAGEAFIPDLSEREPAADDDCCRESCGWWKACLLHLMERLGLWMGHGPEVVPAQEEAAEPQEPFAEEEPAETTEGPPYHDRYHHHHYPSCPYTGACPYPYHYPLPRVQPVETPRPDSQPAEPKKPKTTSFFDFFFPPHGDVDTMECRPSDVVTPPEPRRPF